MYKDDNWNPVQGEELQGFLAQVGSVDGKYQTNPNSTQVAWRVLPFYDQVAMIRLTDVSWAPKNLVLYYLTDQGNLFRLNGTSPNIHEVNSKAPIKVTEENVLDYLRFFCFFVRGEEGPFLVAESMEDPYIPKDLDDKTRVAISNTIHPCTYKGMDNEGNYLCDAVVFYSNALFEAQFSVQPSGMIEMLDDEPVAPDLNARVDAPID